MKRTLLLLLFSLLVSLSNYTAWGQDNEATLKNTCGFNSYLTNSKTSIIAKKLFGNEKINLDKDNPLFLLDSLKAKDKLARKFYFRVVTNSYYISDGYYAEGLGNAGKEYIENNPKEFASYFDNKDCFTDKDLGTWADIVLLEFTLIDENKYNKPIIDDYTKAISLHCNGCSKNQSETINKFSKILKNKWADFLLHIDK